MAPRAVESFGPWALLEAIERRLLGITLAYGYQTQPLVTMDPRKLREPGPADRLLLTLGELSIEQVSGAPRFRPRQTVDIVGVSLPCTDSPQRRNAMLKQDVLTALTTDLSGFVTDLGGGTLSFGTVATDDDGLTTDDGLIAFAIPVVYEWSQQPPW